MPIKFCSEACFFQVWGYLTSLKSQTRDPQLKVSPGGLKLRVFTSWKKSIDLGFELANLGSRSDHVTPRQSKVLAPKLSFNIQEDNGLTDKLLSFKWFNKNIKKWIQHVSRIQNFHYSKLVLPHTLIWRRCQEISHKMICDDWWSVKGNRQ